MHTQVHAIVSFEGGTGNNYVGGVGQKIKKQVALCFYFHVNISFTHGLRNHLRFGQLSWQETNSDPSEQFLPATASRWQPSGDHSGNRVGAEPGTR